MVFVCHELDTKSYRCLDQVTFKLHISTQVIFEESKVWNWDYKKIEDRGGKFKLTFGCNLNYADISV